jgi:hypothetical protein
MIEKKGATIKEGERADTSHALVESLTLALDASEARLREAEGKLRAMPPDYLGGHGARLARELREALERREVEYERAEHFRELYAELVSAIRDLPDPSRDPHELPHPAVEKLKFLVAAQDYPKSRPDAQATMAQLEEDLRRAEAQRDEALKQARLAWDRHAEKDRAYGKFLRERDELSHKLAGEAAHIKSLEGLLVDALRERDEARGDAERIRQKAIVAQSERDHARVELKMLQYRLDERGEAMIADKEEGS